MLGSLCGYKPISLSKIKRVIPCVLLSLFLCVFGSESKAQQRMSAEITTKQVYNKKLIRNERTLYYSSNGKVVVHYTYPKEYFMTSNSLGEIAVYQPDVNEVMLITDKSMATQSEIFLYFLTSDYTNLNLTKLGFVLKEVKKDGNRIIKTFTPTKKEDNSIKKVVVVNEGQKPIYSAVYNKADKIEKKTFYSAYVELPMVTFPTKITQITYNDKGDSIVSREEYNNIKTKDFGINTKFEYSVPSNAKRVNPFGIK